MEENGYRFGVGVLVLASALIGILLVVFFGAVPQFWIGRYTVTINFREAPGVSVDTPVRKSGVQIGRVSRVKLLKPKEGGGVNLELELQSEHEIPQGDQCRIMNGSLITGDAIVEFMESTEASRLARYDGTAGTPKDGILDNEESEIVNSLLKDGDYLAGGVVQPDPFGLVVDMQSTLASTLQSVDRAALRFESLAGNFQQILGGGEGKFDNIVNEARLAISNFNRTAETVNQTAATFSQTAESANRVFNQVEQSRLPELFAEAIGKLPRILDEAETVVNQTKSTLKSFERVGDNFQEVGETANDTLKDIRNFTKPLSGKAGNVLEDVQRTVNHLDGLILEGRQLAGRLNNGQGTFAKLVDDPQLYYSFINTLNNVERLSQQLEPILGDVRVFTDKVSRDPRQLGVKGAISARPLGAGVK